MPTNYAHYRFGCAMLAQMPADIRRTATRFRQLYDMGLHGPDLFLYYNPLLKTLVGSLSKRYHTQSGSSFFTRACRFLRLERNEAGLAYLYGLLCHYCLDSTLHPFVHDNTGEITHTGLETEFDRYLLEKDGKTPAWTYDLSPHIQLTPGESETVAKFYPGATPAQIRTCVRNMAMVTKALASPFGPGRSVIQKGAALAGPNAVGVIMQPQADARCAALMEPMQTLYDAACDRFPPMLEELTAHMTHGAAFSDEFLSDFG